MNDDLKQLVRERLTSDDAAQKPWAGLVLAACDGRETLENLLVSGLHTAVDPNPVQQRAVAAGYLTAITVEGFRGIGPRQALEVNPGPGLTLVIGRNGSGKSSFAEALEVLFTGDSKRWSNRSRIWKEGWRNLHHPHPAAIEADLLLEGEGSARVCCAWDDGSPLEARRSHVQVKGKPRTTLEELGWSQAMGSYRPFLSYNELGSMLDEGPSKLYDALSLVLGLEDLVTAQTALEKSRLERQQRFDEANATREELVELLKKFLERDRDDRAKECLEALSERSWGLDVVERLIGFSSPPADRDLSILNRALSLDAGDAAAVLAAADALRQADEKLRAVAGTDGDLARRLVGLLQAALSLHESHGGSDCPVCGNTSALTGTWPEETRAQIERLRIVAAKSEDAHKKAAEAMRVARTFLPAPPKLLDQLFDIGVSGLAAAREQWAVWHAGAQITDLLALAEHLEREHEKFANALANLRDAVAAEIRRREDRWRPFAAALAEWLPAARTARDGAERIPHLKSAEKWLKEASGEIRNRRFAPIAEKAMATWEHLRQHSSVTLGKIELTGAGVARKVVLDVTVDGVRGAALGVMSQGELHSLALSLFLPRATLPESPYRFVVIDDPVQSMDPARVDGLAKALEETARTRQVIVFTHDDRLPDAVRRLGIPATLLSVTRRPKSVVEVRRALDPIRAHIEDALALVQTADLPLPVVRRMVPGFCRSAIEAACISRIRCRRLVTGAVHSEVEEELARAGKVTALASLALFDDAERGGEVMARLNRFGGWAGDVFRQCKDGAHQEVAGDLKMMIRDAEKLAGKIMELS